jgi:hypothetical protein
MKKVVTIILGMLLTGISCHGMEKKGPKTKNQSKKEAKTKQKNLQKSIKMAEWLEAKTNIKFLSVAAAKKLALGWLLNELQRFESEHSPFMTKEEIEAISTICRVSPRYYAHGFHNGEIRIFDLKTREYILTTKVYQSKICRLQMVTTEKNKQLLISRSEDESDGQTIKAWDPELWKEVQITVSILCDIMEKTTIFSGKESIL